MLATDPSLAFLSLDWLRDLDEAEFQEALGWTAMERAGVSGMRRNASIVQQLSHEGSNCRMS